MESMQREVASLLLKRIHDQGLIAETTYLSAVDLVHSVIDFPEFFQYPVCLTKEEYLNECTQNP